MDRARFILIVTLAAVLLALPIGAAVFLPPLHYAHVGPFPQWRDPFFNLSRAGQIIGFCLRSGDAPDFPAQWKGRLNRHKLRLEELAEIFSRGRNNAWWNALWQINSPKNDAAFRESFGPCRESLLVHLDAYMIDAEQSVRETSQ